MEEEKQKKHSKNYQHKIEMINDLLDDIKVRRDLHYAAFIKFKKTGTVCKSFINTLNATSVCSLVLSFSPVSPATVIVALVATSISSVASVTIASYDLDTKTHSHKTSYLQYIDIHRDISARLRRNGLTSEDLDNILTEINARLGLIEDQSLPIKMKKVPYMSTHHGRV